MGYLYTYVKSFFQLAACRLPLGPGVPLTQCIVQLRCSVRAVCGGPSFAMYNVSFLMLSSGDLHLRLINMKGKNAFIKHNIIMGFYLTKSIENVKKM